MKDYQALLVEINPLALSKGKLLALDAKIVLDDNVSHPEFKQELDPLEKEALKSGFSYLSLEGEIGIIGNGAGLVMATLDMITYFGGKAANFLDLGGGASLEKTVKSLEIVSRRNPKVIFVNIFGGITRCDLIAQGIIDYQDHQMSEIPLVIRMVGTNQKKGEELLLRRGIKICHSMEEGVKKAIEYVYSRQ
jgi:succinyl-CoA synthetase beta subunit